MEFNARNMKKRIPKSYFGMHVSCGLPSNLNVYGSKQCPLFSELGYGMIRLWDGYVPHRLVNTANGVYNWAGMDYRVDAAKALGLKIIYTFGAPPDWAATGNGPYPNYNPNPYSNIGHLTDYAQQVVSRYAGKIDYYETYNEIDSSGSWNGTIQAMIEYGQALYPILKQDSSCKVLSPNVISWGSLNTRTGMGFLNDYLKGAAQYVDVLSMHLYTDPSQPENYLELCRAYKSMAKSYGISSVMCSETGVLSYYGQDGTIKKPIQNGPSDFMSEDQGASWVTRMLLMGWLGGIDSLCYYTLDNVNNVMAINMIDYLPGSGSPTASIKYKPAQSYQYVANTLSGGYLFGFKQSGYLCKAFFSTSKNKKGIIMWCLDYKTAQVDTSAFSGIYDCTGQQLSPSQNYQLTNIPIFCYL